jgi:hypothetical protein
MSKKYKYKTYSDLCLDKYYLEEYLSKLKEEYRYIFEEISDKLYDSDKIDDTSFLFVFCIFLHEKTNKKIKSLENKITSIEKKVYSFKKDEKISTCCVIC